jgi:hypothetical protein
MKRVRRSSTIELSRWNWTRLKQTFTTFLCILMLGPTQALVSAGQEPAPLQNKLVTPAANSGTPVEQTPAVEPDQLPAAPEPQLAQRAQIAQQEQQSSPPQQPVGTAAAPYEKPVGVPGSRPAGAAIAPAKQRRVRAIAIKVGLIAAGAAAVGTVVGLSMASHSQP